MARTTPATRRPIASKVVDGLESRCGGSIRTAGVCETTWAKTTGQETLETLTGRVLWADCVRLDRI